MTAISLDFIAPEQCCCVGRGRLRALWDARLVLEPGQEKVPFVWKKKVDKGTASRSLYCIGSNKRLAYQQGERVRGLGLGRVVERLASPLPSGRTMSS